MRSERAPGPQQLLYLEYLGHREGLSRPLGEGELHRQQECGLFSGEVGSLMWGIDTGNSWAPQDPKMETDPPQGSS